MRLRSQVGEFSSEAFNFYEPYRKPISVKSSTPFSERGRRDLLPVTSLAATVRCGDT